MKRAILTKYHGPTNTRGSRISATDDDGNRVTVPYDHSLSLGRNHDAAAMALCVRLGWGGRLVCGSTSRGFAYVFDPGAPNTTPAFVVG